MKPLDQWGILLSNKIFLEATMDNPNLKQTYKMVGQFFKQHGQHGKKHTVNHLVAMGPNEQSVHHIIARWEHGGPMVRKCEQGRNAIKMPPRNDSELSDLC